MLLNINLNNIYLSLLYLCLEVSINNVLFFIIYNVKIIKGYISNYTRELLFIKNESIFICI